MKKSYIENDKKEKYFILFGMCSDNWIPDLNVLSYNMIDLIFLHVVRKNWTYLGNTSTNPYA